MAERSNVKKCGGARYYQSSQDECRSNQVSRTYPAHLGIRATECVAAGGLISGLYFRGITGQSRLQTLSSKVSSGASRCASPARARDRAPSAATLPLDLLVNQGVSAPVEATAEDGLHDQVVGGRGGSNAHADINLPQRRHVEVRDEEDLLLLLRHRRDVADGAIVRIPLDPAAHDPRKAVADFVA